MCESMAVNDTRVHKLSVKTGFSAKYYKHGDDTTFIGYCWNLQCARVYVCSGSY